MRYDFWIFLFLCLNWTFYSCYLEPFISFPFSFLLFLMYKTVSSWVLGPNFPMAIRQIFLHSNTSPLLNPLTHLLRQPTIALQILRHGVVHLPPPPMSRITRENMVIPHIPVTIIVPITQPWLQTQVMNRINALTHLMHIILSSIPLKNLQLIDPFGQPMPPREDLVEKPLVSAIVRL